MSRSIPQALLALSLLVSCMTAGQVLAQADLSLTLSQSVDAPRQYTDYSVTATITNSGPQTATGVTVSLPAAAGAVFSGGNEFTASQGSFSPYGTQTWNVGRLASGRSATLTVNFFLLAPAAPVTFAQVATSRPADPDSTPGNGTAPTPREDDEASTVSGPPNTGTPDLRLRNLRLAKATVEAGEVLNYTFDLANIGDGDASGDFVVRSFLSRDRAISGDDVRDGVVRTGNFTAGAESLAVPSASRTASLAAGDYFLIVRADAGGQIAESNERNNTAVVPFTVTDGGGGGGGGTTECGFVASIDGIGSSAAAYLARENYVVQQVLPTGRLGRTVLSPTGDILSTSSFDFPATASRFPTRVTLEDGRYALLSAVNNVPEVVITNRNGSESFRFSFDPAATPGFDLVDGPAVLFDFDDVAVTPTGFVATGLYRAASNRSQAAPLVVRFDQRGRFVSGAITEARGDFLSFGIYGVTDEGVVFGFYNTGFRSTLILRISADNEITSANGNLGDLVTNRVGGARLSADGDLLYYTFRDDTEFSVALRAYRVSDFSEAFGVRSELLAPGTDAAFGLVGAPLPLADNGVVFAYEYFERTGDDTRFRVAKVDDRGRVVFITDLADDLALTGQLDVATGLIETPAGDILFATSNGQVFQLTADGSLTPTCGDEEPPTTGGGVDLALSVVSASNAPGPFSNNVVTYTLVNEGDEVATGVRVRIPTPAGTVLTGGNEFVASQGSFSAYGNQVWNVGRLGAGARATIAVSYFSLGSGGYDVYGEVSALNEDDVDSTPGNGNGTSAREDDEAARSLRGGRTAALRISPNPLPLGQTLQIDLGTEIREAFDAQVVVSDLMGRVVIRQGVRFAAGSDVLPVDLTGLVPGIYIVAVPDVAVTSQRLIVR